MKRSWLYVSFAISLVSLLGGTIASARAAAATPAALSVLPGAWNCTAHASDGPSTATVTFTQVLPTLVQYRYSVTSGKGAGHKGGGVWFYDSKKGEYVAMGGGSDGWGVSRGSASASAMTVTLLDTYPSDPTNGTSTFHFAPSTISYTSDWKKGDKPMHFQQTCTKT